MSSRTTLSHPSRLEKQTPSGYCPLTALLHPYLPQSVVGIFQKKKKKKGGGEPVRVSQIPPPRAPAARLGPDSMCKDWPCIIIIDARSDVIVGGLGTR
ncbi:hypothetical protein I7I52_01248 [Histoplasma capsulatum]|uniref:Uncharacterized protein n=1 Tax=Ajellomyces capsulatus TaxID=5037 RepID=A0A8H7Z3Q3_AJECA|nr:hypothetical protein I7I52_01248 [Histoplasma capsulatum]